VPGRACGEIGHQDRPPSQVYFSLIQSFHALERRLLPEITLENRLMNATNIINSITYIHTGIGVWIGVA
jgi:hypothetical protein